MTTHYNSDYWASNYWRSPHWKLPEVLSVESYKPPTIHIRRIPLTNPSRTIHQPGPDTRTIHINENLSS